MSTFTARTIANLDDQWIEDLLVTAFDGQYGGCNYWIHSEDTVRQVRVLTAAGDSQRDDAKGRWEAVEIDFSTTDSDLFAKGGFAMQGPTRPLTARLDKHSLEYAWQRIVNEQPIRSDLVDQFVSSMREGDLDVDADAADCLIQYALFSQVVFG